MAIIEGSENRKRINFVVNLYQYRLHIGSHKLHNLVKFGNRLFSVIHCGNRCHVFLRFFVCRDQAFVRMRGPGFVLSILWKSENGIHEASDYRRC